MESGIRFGLMPWNLRSGSHFSIVSPLNGTYTVDLEAEVYSGVYSGCIRVYSGVFRVYSGVFGGLQGRLGRKPNAQ